MKDDRPKRDYIHVSDIVEAIVAAIETEQTTDDLRTYNLGTGISFSVKEIVDLVRDLFNTEIDYLCTNEFRPNDVMDTVADISKIKNELHWSPAVSIREGLQKML